MVPRRPVQPSSRRLRAYAFDPHLDTQMETAVINRMTAAVPWESLAPGPIGEYVEVIDYDPASNCWYPPVDLEHPYLLAQDGLEPSEGTPQFHQQMSYAVVSLTIHNFEHALGRRVLWSPRRVTSGKDIGDEYVQRLRIYPHALREANSYYDPQKKALLLGYFPANGGDTGKYLPGGTVFCCLCHDIIAHETTHALLDGMHRRFIEPTNPDVLAFHEAFADLVALLQHFTFPEVLRYQIARTRGDLAGQNLLGQLAQEFGVATGTQGALRDALGEVDPATGKWRPRKPDANALSTTYECHARGAILVAAVFAAFLSIYKSRVEDLFRIATDGRGVLPAGDLHPDLVNRLAQEAAKSAQHTLTMCVRALDYCPPVDITFGEYLRALITADHELVPADDREYRTAFIEAFRQYGIYPRDVRALSQDSLLWQTPDECLPAEAIKRIGAILDPIRKRWSLEGEREDIYKTARGVQAELHGWVVENLKILGPSLRLRHDWSDGTPAALEVHSVRPAQRSAPNGMTKFDVVIELTQRCWIDAEGKMTAVPEPETQAPPGSMLFRGGCTLIMDADTGEMRYAIIKSIDSKRRQALQRRYLNGELGTEIGLTYGGVLPPDVGDQPFSMIHRATSEGGL